MTKDPVCDMAIDEKKAGTTATYHGKTYYFCSESCKSKFQKEPERYSGSTGYTFGKAVALPFERAIERVTEALSREGFGVLTEIDVAATLKKKLGKEMPPYRILGACNPQFAHRAIEAEPQIGALLPCNVVVRQDAQGRTLVEIMDPQAVMQLVGRPEIAEIGAEVRKRLERVLAAL